ncbi:hypothetical protein [Tessaracoccus sp.]
MSATNDATNVGVVGSPSTNWEISLDVLGSASHEPIVGGMLFLTHPLGTGEELALGTVTEVETSNTFHQNPLLRGVVKAKGTLSGMSGDMGDIRSATIKIQACYKRPSEDKPWAQSGPSMRTSPPTGALLKQINDDVISDLMAGEKDLHYLGRLHSTDVKIPMSMRDFSGERGAVHQAVFGLSGSGKALDVNTPIPTPTGWTTMGDLCDGDVVFDEAGNPTTVVKAHEVRLDRPCYEVVFSDDSVIVADEEHLWETRYLHSGLNVKTQVLTTKQIKDSLSLTGHGPATKSNHAIPVTAPLNLPARDDLPVAPYTLGLWLAAGDVTASGYRSENPELAMLVEADGYTVRGTEHPDGYQVDGLREGLVEAGLTAATISDTPDGKTGPPQIPQAYLRASEAQRRALLAGLLDGAGTTAPGGVVRFTCALPHHLARGVAKLVRTLGYLPTVATLHRQGAAYAVEFTTADQVFTLNHQQVAHKANSQWLDPVKTGYRYITYVEPVESRPVRCITVDSPNSLYLAGKEMIPTHNTVFANYILAGQMRHKDMGMIIVDPQGQFSSETGFSFSLQAWAAEMGREVIVRRVSEDLRLEKDAPLFVSLLSKTKFTREIQKMAAETAEILMEEFAKVLKSYDGDWDEADSSVLLRAVIDSLRDPKKLKKVYADPSRQRRLLESLSDILGEIPEVDESGNEVDQAEWDLARPAETTRLFRELLSQFAPLHNLFSDKNPNGDKRHSMWGTITSVFDKSSRNGAPAPLLILDMSTSGNVSWLKSLVADEDTAHAMEAIRVLDQDSIKASILSKVCATLKNASEAEFRKGDTLNTMVVFDEAWRYAPPPHLASVEEIADLSRELAGYARDTRKFGIGWFYITQSPRSLNDDIWGQLSVRIIGYGLGGADLAKVGEQMDDPDHLKLYRGFAPPESTNPKVYPFMMVGPVSPLSFTKAPVFLSAYTNFEDFRLDNYQWIGRVRSEQGLPVLTGTPAMVSGVVVPISRRAKVGRSETDRAAEQVRLFRSTGGVNPADSAHLSKDDSFAGAAVPAEITGWGSPTKAEPVVVAVADSAPGADHDGEVSDGFKKVSPADTPPF